MKPTNSLLQGELRLIHPPCHITYYKPIRNKKFIQTLARLAQSKFPTYTVRTIEFKDRYILKVEE